ncbi:hypothetical protein AB2N08_09895 [Massilia aurea]|uniref:hypothetical protein n=1 Tax=Massilia aurea TaxID=373040 RepID=UPI003463703B
MRYRAFGIAIVAMLCARQAGIPAGLPGEFVALTGKARQAMTLRVRLGEGFQNNTVSVLVDGAKIYQRADVSTDLTISRADSVDVELDGASVRLEVSVQDGPTEQRTIELAETPFVEVRLMNGQLQMLPLPQEPPML